MRAVLLFLLCGTACLQPVGEAGAPRVTSCVGACPAGVCTECTPPDAGCTEPQCELQRYACSKSTPCDAYEDFPSTAPFPPGDAGAYCVILQGGGAWSIGADGGSVRCNFAPHSCDAGVVTPPAECTPCARKTYCIGP